MVKALIIAADSVTPEIIFGRRELFPVLNRMMEEGAHAPYCAYVQKGYRGSYSSEQNWASIYTGLEPGRHKIDTRRVRGEKRRPQMGDLDGLQPFWKVLNENGLRVGLWAADNCAAPVPVDGYAVSVTYRMIDTPEENREAPRQLQLCEKDRNLTACLPGDPPPRLYPRTLFQRGYSFDRLLKDPELAEEAAHGYGFEEALPNFEAELEYWFRAVIKAQHTHPVDVLYLFTPTTDLIAHCCMSCDDNPVLLAAYQLLDRYIGRLQEELEPEFTVFLSDHGQQNFKELIRCPDPAVRREAFAARDQVLWLKNGYIAFEAHNGALLYSAHSLKGTFVLSGPGIRHTQAEGLRTLDLYPTLLELFGIRVPEGRRGFVADIFDRPTVNADRILRPDQRKGSSIALLQTHAAHVTDIILNELFLEKRFGRITVVGESKYEEIFRGNPRAAGFLPLEKFDFCLFDEVYCGVCHEDTKEMYHVKIWDKREG